MASSSWKVAFPVTELQHANDTRLAHHRERVAHWKKVAEDKRKEAEASVQIFDRIEDARTGSRRYSGTTADAMTGMGVKIDPVLLHEHEKARGRYHAHMSKLRYHEEWTAFFDAAPKNATFDCEISDLQLFRIGNYTELEHEDEGGSDPE